MIAIVSTKSIHTVTGVCALFGRLEPAGLLARGCSGGTLDGWKV